MYLLIVSGMSGAGKSQALNKLEDMGFFCVDNLPAALMSDFARLCRSKGDLVEKAAIGLDSREGMTFEQIFARIDELRTMGISTEVLFLDAPDDVLVRRYKETRRNHPLARDGRVQDGIARERAIMQKLSSVADYTIDTGEIKPAQLGARIEQLFGAEEGFSLFVMSFGYKHGIPIDADFVFDMRFLPNPFWVEELRPLCGCDDPVAQYVFESPEAQLFMDGALQMIKGLLPSFEREGKKQLVMAFGCTGGQHRSVCMAERFYAAMVAETSKIKLLHRDVVREGK